MISPRGPLALRRIAAHWVVLTAATLTILVAATVSAALSVFTGQALPRAVEHDLGVAPGTALSVTALVSTPSQAAAGTAGLRSHIAAAMPGIPFSFQEALWSDSLGLVPGALPASPASVGKGNRALLEAASMTGIASHATLVAGQWPTSPGASQGQAIPAALPASAAALLHVSPGDVLRLRDTSTNAPVSFDITGVFVPRQQAGQPDSYWELSYFGTSGKSAGFESTTYGPLVVSQAAFGPALPMLSGSWMAQPDMSAFQAGSIGPVLGSVSALKESLPNSSYLSGAQLTTSLLSVLTEAEGNLSVARSLLVISALELLALAIAALLAVARLLTTQREGETALLVARGATRSQLTWLTATEVIPLSALVSVIGALAGVRLADMLVAAGPLGSAGIRLTGRAGIWPDALAAAIVVTVIASASLLAPGLTPSPATARSRRGRQAAVTAAARAGLDIAMVVLALLAGWQLRHYSAATNGGAGIDPVLALAPALALAAGSVVTLRLLPAAARMAERLAVRGRGLSIALASWRISRMPIRQGGTALLLTMAVATGTLALAQHASWLRSASDQAAFSNGGDVQVDLSAPLASGGAGAITAAPGVTHAMAVNESSANPGEVVAIDATQASQAVRLRGDESPLPAASLFRAITPGDLPGAVLPAPQAGARAGTIQLTGTLGPSTAASASTSASTSTGSALGPVAVTLTVLDRTGIAYQIAAGTLAADGRPHLLVAHLGGDQALYPLRVAAITATFLLPPSQGPSLALTLSGPPLAGWIQEASSFVPTDLDPDALGQPSDGPTHFTRDSATFTFAPGWADTTEVNVSPPPPTPVPGQLVLLPQAPLMEGVPAIATRAFMNANSTAIGAVVPEFLDGTQVPMRIVAEVTSFPTVTGSAGAVITDLGGLQEYLARRSLPPLPVTQWWLATAGGGVPASLTAAVPAGTGITSAAALATATASDPLSAAPQQALLAMAAAAAVLAITGFWVSIAADVRRRRGEMALLSALGVTRREAALQLCLEKLLLSLPAAVLGVLLGTLVAWLLVPAVTLTAAAQLPTPPAVTVASLPLVVAFALAVAVLPAVTAALAATRRPDPAAELRAAEDA